MRPRLGVAEAAPAEPVVAHCPYGTVISRRAPAQLALRFPAADTRIPQIFGVLTRSPLG